MKKLYLVIFLFTLSISNSHAEYKGKIYGGSPNQVFFNGKHWTGSIDLEMYLKDQMIPSKVSLHCSKYNKNTFKFRGDDFEGVYPMMRHHKRYFCARNEKVAVSLLKDTLKQNNKWNNKAIIKNCGSNACNYQITIKEINHPTRNAAEEKDHQEKLKKIAKQKEKERKEAEKNKPKTVAKKPSKGELGIPDGFCPGEDGKSLVPCDEKVVKKPEPEIVSKKPVTKSDEIDGSLLTIGSGSAFYINGQGYALSNNHVVNICKQSVAQVDGREILFRVVATDKTNDVAILKTDQRSRNYIKINEDGAKLGENIVAVGYPLAGRLSDSVKITRGIVSSLSGINNNIGQIQIDAALQPGNSGGPVLNEKGEMIGIASAGLNKLLMAKEAKYIPENVNFAVAAPIVVNILKNKKIKYSSSGIFGGKYSNTELAELGNSATIQLLCRNTRTAYNRLKGDKKYTHVLLDLE